MATDLGLITYTTQAGANKLAAQGAGNTAAQARLTHTRRANETEDGAAHLVAGELTHRQVLEDPLLHLLEAVVILVQHLLSLADADLTILLLAPGQVGDPVEVGANNTSFRAVHALLGEAFHLVEGLTLHIVRCLHLVDFAA